MYKIEYLVIADKTTTKSVQALENLLKSDDDIQLQDGCLEVGNFKGKYTISKGEVAASDNKGLYFHLSFECEEEEEIPAFGKALRRVRGRLSFLNQKQFVIWDDVSRHYSHKAYSQINYIENLMRKLLTKFMLVNLGMNWDKQRMPNDVFTSIHKDNKDFNHLNNLDFIKLSDFLFSKNYPKHKEDVFKKLDAAKSSADIDLDEIRSLLPRSNWTKYFGSIIDCDGDFIEKRWEQLYQLRNAVAHNKTFGLKQLEEVENLVGEIGEYLEVAVAKLDEVVVPKEQIEDVVQEVVTEGREELAEFLNGMEELEHVLRKFYQLHFNQYNRQDLSIYNTIDEIISLDDKYIFNHEDHFNLIFHLFDLKDNIKIKKKYVLQEFDFLNFHINNFIEILNKRIPYEEGDHLTPIKSNRVKQLYQTIKDSLLNVGLILKINKHYISFLKEESNIIDIKLQQRGLKIWLNAPKGSLSDPNKITRDVSHVGHLGNGDYEVILTKEEQLQKLMLLVQQVLDKAPQ
ncbi:MAG: hypothetical protein ACRBFS_05765 [Aureispira sp.]